MSASMSKDFRCTGGVMAQFFILTLPSTRVTHGQFYNGILVS